MKEQDTMYYKLILKCLLLVMRFIYSKSSGVLSKDADKMCCEIDKVIKGDLK